VLAFSPAPPLVLLALADERSTPPPHVVTRLRAAGATVYITHGPGGCLRVAAALEPRVILLDRGLPQRLIDQLRAHPSSAHALITDLA
jgi:hypothetical protein